MDDLEGCDDGGVVDGDGCSAACAIEEGFDCSVCAQAEANGGACPAGTVCIDGDCQEPPGWGEHDPCVANEQCALGEVCYDTDFVNECSGSWEDNPVEVCRAVCGDGLVVAGEECDEGDIESGDGCGVRCQLEDYDCAIDLDCACGTWCDEGHCTPGCVHSAECGTQICVDHACADAPACADDSGCASLGDGWYCDEDELVCDEECDDYTECQGDEYCDPESRECYPGPGLGEECVTRDNVFFYCAGDLLCVGEDGVMTCQERS